MPAYEPKRILRRHDKNTIAINQKVYAIAHAEYCLTQFVSMVNHNYVAIYIDTVSNDGAEEFHVFDYSIELCMRLACACTRSTDIDILGAEDYGASVCMSLV